RDSSVTGVQTCALPILGGSQTRCQPWIVTGGGGGGGGALGAVQGTAPWPGPALPPLLGAEPPPEGGGFGPCSGSLELAPSWWTSAGMGSRTKTTVMLAS